MIDSNYLELKISEAGKTKSHLAKKLGISLQTLRLKITNASDFTTTQVNVLCDELNIKKLSEKEKIFFKK